MRENESETTLVSWNILLDYKRRKFPVDSPQYIPEQKERIDIHVETLMNIGVPLDAVCLQEVQNKHGEYIATRLGHRPGTWFNHNTTRRGGEHIGMFGTKVASVEEVQTRHDKVAVFTKIGSLAVVGFHNRHEIFGPMRSEQTEDFLGRVVGQECAALMGDLNAVGWQKPNRLIRDAGFVSVFELLGLPEPKTHPVDAYRDIFYSPVKKLILPHGTASDRIYVRGCEVLDAGVFESDAADHRGVWATVRPSVSAS